MRETSDLVVIGINVIVDVDRFGVEGKVWLQGKEGGYGVGLITRGERGLIFNHEGGFSGGAMANADFREEEGKPDSVGRKWGRSWP